MGLLPDRVDYSAADVPVGKFEYVKFSEDREINTEISKFLIHYRHARGKQGLACEHASISVNKLNKWRQNFGDLQDVMNQIEALTTDVRLQKAEDVLEEALDSDNEANKIKVAMHIEKQEKGTKNTNFNKNVNINVSADAKDLGADSMAAIIDYMNEKKGS